MGNVWYGRMQTKQGVMEGPLTSVVYSTKASGLLKSKQTNLQRWPEQQHVVLLEIHKTVGPRTNGTLFLKIKSAAKLVTAAKKQVQLGLTNAWLLPVIFKLKVAAGCVCVFQTVSHGNYPLCPLHCMGNEDFQDKP